MTLTLLRPWTLSATPIQWPGNRGVVSVGGDFESFRLQMNGQAGPTITSAGSYLLDAPTGAISLTEVVGSPAATIVRISR